MSLNSSWILVLFLSLYPTWTFSQLLRRCAVGHGSSWLDRYQQLELQKQSVPNAKVGQTVLRIPVVVHVVHSEPSLLTGLPGSGNISDEQIFSQIAALNEDYRGQPATFGRNIIRNSTDLGIEFFLATVDPQGLPTSGIVRVRGPKKSYDVFDDNFILSSLSYWDSNRYLNIWVTSLNDNFLGIGEFPGGDFDGLDTGVPEEVDGIIIDHTVFGRKTGTAKDQFYGYGRTLTHEVGHWLGLIHTWGDQFCGTDFVEDTPPTESPNQSLSCNPRFSSCGGVRTRNQIENFMDYTIDTCMQYFTSGQSVRIREVLEIAPRRKRLIEYTQFQFPIVEDPQWVIYNNPGTSREFALQFLVPGFQDFTLDIYSSDGRHIYTEAFIQTPSTIWRSQGKGIGNLGSGLYLCRWTIGGRVLTRRVWFYSS